MGMWLLHLLGLDNTGGRWYGWWSGAGSDLGELALIGGILRMVRHHKRAAGHAEAQRAILADLYEHHTGQRHPLHPDDHAAPDPGRRERG